MDTWYKFKNIKIKQDITQINISKQICYGHYLLSDIIWKTVNHKKPQKLFNKFFENASLVLQATLAQKGFDNKEMIDVYNYIDKITKDLMTNSTGAEDYSLMLGNLSEFDDMKYTFTELIAFVRAIAAKI